MTLRLFKKQNSSIICAFCGVEFTPINPRRLCCTDICTKKRDDRKYYLRHKERIYKAIKAHVNQNRQKYLDYLKKYRNNPEKKQKIREQKRAWENRNSSAKRKYTADYRARKDNRTPKWLTKEQHEQIKQFYKLAKELQNSTGIRYSVDHIVPLRAKNVSGLHVPWNLQVIPLLENCKKRNLYE